MTATCAPPANHKGSLSHRKKNYQVHFPSFQALSSCLPVVGGLWDGLFFVRGAGVMMGGVCGSGAVEECRNLDHGLERGEGGGRAREIVRGREGGKGDGVERGTNKCTYLVPGLL